MIIFQVAFLFLFQIAISNGFLVRPKIINGILSNPMNYPFYVSIGRDGATFGGTLLSDRWVITAAHCLIWEDEKMSVYLGISTFGSFSEKMEVNKSNRFIYPEYSAYRKANDIALLHLPQPVSSYSPNIKPIKLPIECSSVHLGNENVIAIGNGLTKIDSIEKDKRMRQAQFTTITPDQCILKLSTSNNMNTIICANSSNGQSVYFGDSGGPLIRENDGFLIGLMSFVQMDTSYSSIELQVFTNIFYYFDWISHVTAIQLPQCKGPQAIPLVDEE